MTVASAPAPAVDLRCHRCSYWLAAACAHAAELVAIFKPRSGFRVYAPAPLRAYKCEHCGWMNVFVTTVVAGGTPNGRD